MVIKMLLHCSFLRWEGRSNNSRGCMCHRLPRIWIHCHHSAWSLDLNHIWKYQLTPTRTTKNMRRHPICLLEADLQQALKDWATNRDRLIISKGFLSSKQNYSKIFRGRTSNRCKKERWDIKQVKGCWSSMSLKTMHLCTIWHAMVISNHLIGIKITKLLTQVITTWSKIMVIESIKTYHLSKGTNKKIRNS